MRQTGQSGIAVRTARKRWQNSQRSARNKTIVCFHTAGVGCSIHPTPTNLFKTIAYDRDSALWINRSRARRSGPMLATLNRTSPQPRVRCPVMAGYDLYTIARFWAKVKVGHPSQCWEWQGGAGEKGYGRFKIAGRLVLSHHVSWELANGPLPNASGYHGAVVRHICDNPACVNWRHLRTGTQQENVLDMDVKGRRGANPTKLTIDQVKAIIADPRSHRTIAADYGISHTHIGAIKRGDRLGKILAKERDEAKATATPIAVNPVQGILL